MADGKRRYKSDRKDYKISVKLSEKDMDILKAALKRTRMTASAYIRELIRTGGNIDTSYPEDRARAIRVIAGIANNINQAVKLGNSQGKLYYSDIDKLQSNLDDVKKIRLIPENLFGNIIVKGNAALTGAAMILLNDDLKENSAGMFENVQVLNLAEYSDFQKMFIEEMNF